MSYAKSKVQLTRRMLVPGSRHVRSLWTGRAPGATRHYEHRFEWVRIRGDYIYRVRFARVYCSKCGIHMPYVQEGADAVCFDCRVMTSARLLFSERQRLRERNWDWGRPEEARVCREEGCITILSAYNQDKRCDVHSREEPEYVWKSGVGYVRRRVPKDKTREGRRQDWRCVQEDIAAYSAHRRTVRDASR